MISPTASGQFDHDILLGILAEKIRDNRFLRLIRNMLKAGYLEDWQYHDTLSGTPQGGVVSPVLSNIYLHKLDEFVEKELIPRYTRGDRRKENPEYDRVNGRRQRAAAAGTGHQAREQRQQMRALPYGDPMDPGYRRLFYCRYADDHLLGFIGPKAEAEQIKAELAAFLRETLALELNASKTLITHARTGAARFLGYEITVQHCSTQTHQGPAGSANGRIALRVPPDVITAKCAPYRRRGKPWHRPRAAEPGRLRHRADLRSRIPGHRELLPARPERLAAGHAALERRDIDAEDTGRQAQVHRHQDGGPPQGQDHHRRRAPDLLRGPPPARRASRT